MAREVYVKNILYQFIEENVKKNLEQFLIKQTTQNSATTQFSCSPSTTGFKLLTTNFKLSTTKVGHQGSNDPESRAK